MKDGSLLISDDYAGAIYRVSYRSRRFASCSRSSRAWTALAATPAADAADAEAGRRKAESCARLPRPSRELDDPTVPSAGEPAADL